MTDKQPDEIEANSSLFDKSSSVTSDAPDEKYANQEKYQEPLDSDVDPSALFFLATTYKEGEPIDTSEYIDEGLYDTSEQRAVSKDELKCRSDEMHAHFKESGAFLAAKPNNDSKN
ncbi:hypothetical protein [Halegenticoccus soli]|uniref:hypothetical protein n=1 Tax=Halegenticoccus soli TaxID=1985678 RepID=UPI000C6D515E|nr:hypothetical protein [Halegenticoccus soli]